MITFLEQELDSKAVTDSCFEADGVNYYGTLFTLIFPPATWDKNRVTFFKRFLIQSHVRNNMTVTSRGSASGAAAAAAASASASATDEMKEFSVYKSGLAFFALIHGVYEILFKVSLDSKLISHSSQTISSFQDLVQEDDWSLDWPLMLAETIRRNDQQLLENSDKLLSFLQQDVLSCTSFTEFVDVMRLSDQIPDADVFLSQTLKFK